MGRYSMVSRGRPVQDDEGRLGDYPVSEVERVTPASGRTARHQEVARQPTRDSILDRPATVDGRSASTQRHRTRFACFVCPLSAK